MAIGDVINQAGELAQITGESVANPLPVEPRQYILADTIGKLKSCNSKWQITHRMLAIPAGTPTEIAAENGGRVLLMVMFNAATLQVYPQGANLAGPGIRINVTDQNLLINYDVYGPLVGNGWTGIDSAGQIINVVEVIANQ